ncbi:MAG: hypothetical protein RMJ67_03945 [Elusimicrobiota bacterium]|nr:hypothetical protein [Endomicrobiia bacterium]MDW8165643.1 hypothetical protein [Elusimicrobiota bacterium]
MAKKIINVPLAIYTDKFLITGFVKIRPKLKYLFRKYLIQRISEIIDIAGERMEKVGEKQFLEVTNADILDLETKEIIRSQIKRLVVNKNAIRIIIPIDIKPIEEIK